MKFQPRFMLPHTMFDKFPEVLERTIQKALTDIYADLKEGGFCLKTVSTAPTTATLDTSQAAICTDDNKLYINVNGTIKVWTPD